MPKPMTAIYENSITVVVVTCDREKYLGRCISSLSSQAESRFNILIIDNGTNFSVIKDSDYQFESMVSSVDFREKGQLFIDASERQNCVYAFDCDTNLGSAGGFALGIEMAIELFNSDYILLMDDDGFLSDDHCISKLRAAMDEACLDVANALVCNDENPNELSFGLGKNVKTRDVAQSIATDGLIHEKANFFNATLVSRTAISKAGNIRKEMFIWGDEVEFLLRLKKYDCKVATVTNAICQHPKPKVITTRVLGIFRVSIKPQHLALCLYRNVGFLKKEYDRSTGGMIWKHMLYYILKLNLAYVLMIWKYSRDFDYELPPLPLKAEK